MFLIEPAEDEPCDLRNVLNLFSGLVQNYFCVVMKAERVSEVKMQEVYSGGRNDISIIIINISDEFHGNKAAAVVEQQEQKSEASTVMFAFVFDFVQR